VGQRQRRGPAADRWGPHWRRAPACRARAAEARERVAVGRAVAVTAARGRGTEPDPRDRIPSTPGRRTSHYRPPAACRLTPPAPGLFLPEGSGGAALPVLRLPDGHTPARPLTRMLGKSGRAILARGRGKGVNVGGREKVFGPLTLSPDQVDRSTTCPPGGVLARDRLRHWARRVSCARNPPADGGAAGGQCDVSSHRLQPRRPRPTAEACTRTLSPRSPAG